MSLIYTAVATVSGGREGKGRTDDGRLKVALAPPKELGGSSETGTNPEQLFAMAYAACFESALRLVAKQRGNDIGNSSLTATVKLFSNDTDGYHLDVELCGVIPGASRAEAEDLLRNAHGICPYSKATRGNIDVRLVAAEEPPAQEYSSELPSDTPSIPHTEPKVPRPEPPQEPGEPGPPTYEDVPPFTPIGRR